MLLPRLRPAAGFLLPLLACAAEPDPHALTLWYDRPAVYWEEALPVGNGRIGAMVHGGVLREHEVLAAAADLGIEDDVTRAVRDRRTRLAAGGQANPINPSDSSNVGWSLAWNAGLWARLGDAVRAHETFSHLVRRAAFPNLLDFHPRKGTPGAFQIDGNLAGAAAVAEMLLQSHAGEVELLPALPPAWPEGRVQGLRARGGFTIDLAWRQGVLTAATVAANRAGPCRLRCAQPFRIDGHASHPDGSGHILAWDAGAGRKYRVERP